MTTSGDGLARKIARDLVREARTTTGDWLGRVMGRYGKVQVGTFTYAEGMAMAVLRGDLDEAQIAEDVA